MIRWGNQRGKKMEMKFYESQFLVGMNERNGACLQLPASCSLSSYIDLLFKDGSALVGGKERERRVKQTGKWENEDGREWSRRDGLVLVRVVLVSHYRCGERDHKGSQRILILVSPNLLTYLTYPEELTEDSSGTLRQLNPKRVLLFPTRQPPILLFASLVFSFLFSLFLSLSLPLRSPSSLLPLLPVFSGTALR